MEEVSRIHINISASKKQDYQKQARNLGITMTKFITEAADRYLVKTKAKAYE